MHSIRKLKKEGAQVVDVDGSYLYRKLQASAASVDASTVPEPPLIGWESLEGPITLRVLMNCLLSPMVSLFPLEMLTIDTY